MSKKKVTLEEAKETLSKSLTQKFKPEFLNRIDEIITFNSLDKDTIYEILDNIVNSIQERLKDKRLTINLTNEAKKYIIDESYNESFGARPIKRYVTKNIESLIANNILEDKIKYNSTITIDVKDNKFIIK